MASLNRQLAGMEYGLWFMDLAASVNFIFVAEISGKIPAQALEDAVKAIQSRHELLRMRVIVDKKKRAYFTLTDEPISILTHVLKPNKKNLENLLEQENQNRFDTSAGPLCRVLLADRGDNQALILTLHHSIADGICGAELMQDLLAATDAAGGGNALDKTLIKSPGPMESLFENKYTGFIALERAVSALLGQGVSKNVLRRYGFAQLDEKISPDKRQQRFVLRSLDAEESRALSARAKAEKTTVHGALCAAQLLAVAAETKKQKPALIPQLSLVDMRKQVLKPVDPRAMGVYISSVESSHKIDKETDFWALARQIKDGISAQLEKNAHFSYWPSLMRLMYLTRAATPQNAKGAAKSLSQGEIIRPAASICSNIGNLKARTKYTSFVVKKFYFLMAVSGSGYFASSANGFDNRIFINFTHASPTISRERAVRMADKTCELLRLASAK